MVDFVEANKMFFTRYVDFEGRSTRSEFWWVFLAWWIAAMMTLILFLALGINYQTEEISIFGVAIISLFMLFYLGTLIPGIALRVRRLHDQDLSGGFYFLRFIPYMGGLVILIFMIIEGTRGRNRFGPDPVGGY